MGRTLLGLPGIPRENPTDGRQRPEQAVMGGTLDPVSWVSKYEAACFLNGTLQKAGGESPVNGGDELVASDCLTLRVTRIL